MNDESSDDQTTDHPRPPSSINPFDSQAQPISVTSESSVTNETMVAAVHSQPQSWWGSFQNQDPNRRWWTPIVIAGISFPIYFGASAIAAIVVVLAIAGVSGLGNAKSFSVLSESRSGFLFMVIVPQMILIVPAIAAAIASPVRIARRLHWVRGHWPIWAWIAAALGTPLVGMISGAIVGLFLEESESLKEMSSIFRNLGTGVFAFIIAFAIGITPAICEEILFRGYIQSRLTKALPVWMGIFVSSILFAAYHIDSVHVVAVFPMGIYLGWLSYRSGSIFPAMLGHFVNNFISVLLVVFAPEPDADVLAVPTAMFAITILGVGVAGLLLTLYASLAFSADDSVATVASESLPSNAIDDVQVS